MHRYVIALYIRLSLEDAKYDSMSIENQRLILREKALSLTGCDDTEILEFVDNGHSGTNFERPAVQELLSMVQSGKIDCIIVKDLSRFGRNSIETGYFIERVFPLYHTRFISVSDGFDTANYKGDTGGIDVAFKYLISECYSRDMSMKTRSAKYAKMRRGEYQSMICPYGYKKGQNGRMEPNEETAEVVRKIFLWASEGSTVADITRKLYALNIPTPGEYRANKGKPIYDVSETHGVWSNSTVIRILEDERYIGTYDLYKDPTALHYMLHLRYGTNSVVDDAYLDAAKVIAKPEFQYLVAASYVQLQEKELANVYYLRTLLLDENSKCIGMLFSLNQDRDFADATDIRTGIVCALTSDCKTIKIAIHDPKVLKGINPNNFANCIHLSSNDPSISSLLYAKAGDTVQFESDSYIYLFFCFFLSHWGFLFLTHFKSLFFN